MTDSVEVSFPLSSFLAASFLRRWRPLARRPSPLVLSRRLEKPLPPLSHTISSRRRVYPPSAAQLSIRSSAPCCESTFFFSAFPILLRPSDFHRLTPDHLLSPFSKNNKPGGCSRSFGLLLPLGFGSSTSLFTGLPATDVFSQQDPDLWCFHRHVFPAGAVFPSEPFPA